nr:MAG TPA: hypothetical protein [Caudoviricetes sp.]
MFHPTNMTTDLLPIFTISHMLKFIHSSNFLTHFVLNILSNQSIIVIDSISYKGYTSIFYSEYLIITFNF